MAEIIEIGGKRFQRTSEFRWPRSGEYYIADGIVLRASFDHAADGDQYPILREIPAETPQDIGEALMDRMAASPLITEVMSKPETGHTPLPWHYQQEADAYTHILRGPGEQYVVGFSQDASGRAKADAHLTLEAINSHAALVEAARALKRLTNAVDGGIYRPEQEDWNIAEAALAELKKADIL